MMKMIDGFVTNSMLIFSIRKTQKRFET